MDLTLKSVAGPEKEQQFICSGPETYLGRSQRCAIRLASAAISFEHALITRKGDEFFIENLSANGTLLNNERLGGGSAASGTPAKARLRQKDTIQLGPETVLRVESLPAVAAGSSPKRWLLVALLLVMIILGAGVIVWDQTSSTTSSDWSKAYQPLQQFVQGQTDQHQLPPEFPQMFREAWRLHISGDRNNEAAAWKRLSVLLDFWDQKQSIDDTHPSRATLQALKDGKSPDLAQDGRPALKYFITVMSHR